MNPNMTHVQKFIGEKGKRANPILAYLGKNLNFMQAWNSELGKGILEWEVEKSNKLLEKIYNCTATQIEQVEFKLLTEKHLWLTNKFETYYKAEHEVLHSED